MSVLVTSAVSPFTVLTQTAQATASETQKIQIAQITQDLQNETNQQIAALQAPTDQVSVNYSQQQINALMAQQKTISGLETRYGSNANILADLTNQLAKMAGAATAGNSTSFDNARTAATTDLNDLAVIAYNPLFQADGIASLKTNGLGVNSSASYNLSTPAGQAAAGAAVAAAQTLFSSSFKTTSANQTLAASQSTALNGQISALQTLESQTENAQTTQIATETQQLQTNMQNQLHLIELNIGDSGELATEIFNAANPPQPVSSVFGELETAAVTAATPAGSSTNQPSAPAAILSLFA